jgi:cell division protease FtsH
MIRRKSRMDRKTKFLIGYWIVAFLVMFAVQTLIAAYAAVQPIPYSEFQERLRRGQVEEIAISDQDIRGRLRQPLPGGSRYFVTTRVEPAFAKELDAYHVRYAGRIESNWLRDLLSWIIPVLVFVGLWFWIGRRVAEGSGGLMTLGRSKAKVYVETNTGVTFDDVAGAEEAKEELREIVDFLKAPKKFARLGARMPKGVLLVGPPGTGKTLLAKAVAGQAKVPFFSISGSEFVEMFVGVGASRVRDLFDQAKRNSPCIVFVDEIDAVGRQRGAGLGGSHDEREQTLNQILVEMDGFDTNTNVIVVAATNRPDVLDPALLRPGRFDRQVILDRPDMKGRVAILKVHTKGKPLDKGVDVEGVARQSPGFSGADLANLVNEAAILSARRNKKVIGMSEFQEALERIVAGPERKSRIISDAEKAIIAYHEGGHAVVQRILPKCDPVQKVTIISRGMALGYTMALPSEDRYLQSKTEFEDKIAGLLGGNVSERLIFGDTTTGASNDIEKATDLARRMVTEFGMSDKLGPLSFGKRDELVFLGREIGEQRNYSDEVAKQIDEEVRAIIDHAYERAMEVLVKHRDKLTALAEKLVAEETVDAEEFEKLFSDLPPKENTHGIRPQIVGPGQPTPAPAPNPQPA